MPRRVLPRRAHDRGSEVGWVGNAVLHSPCPDRVNNGPAALKIPLPFHTEQRTSPDRTGWSARSHERKWPDSFDHSVGTCEHVVRYVETKRLCRLEIDHQFEARRLLIGHLARPSAVQNVDDLLGICASSTLDIV
jgi:hypothetical protein